MARNGSGTMSIPNPDFVAGTTISSSQVDANNTDIVNEITNSIAADGQTTPTANLKMGGYKHTGLGNGSAATDSISLGQAQANAFTYQGTDTGAADAYVIALTPAITTQAAGLRVSFVAANASTGPSTLNAGGGADAIEYQGAAFTGAEISAGSTIVCEHDGTAFQMVSPSALLTTNTGTVTASSTDTFTNKTIDANGTGNSISNIDVADLANGTDGELITWDATGAPAVVAVGTATHVLTSNGTGAAPTFQAPTAGVFTESFTSAEQTITSAGALTIAHGLSTAPKLVSHYIICKTAEFNYSIGDTVQPFTNDSTNASQGVAIVPDATNLNVRMGSSATVFNTLNKTTGTQTTLTNANWKLVLEAWA